MASSTSAIQERPHYSVYVGNLPDGILQSHVEQKLFAGLNVESVRLVKDRETDKFRGFAYVDFKTREDYDNALKRNGIMINERPLRISPSEKKNNQNNNRGGYGGGGNMDRRNNGNRNTYPNNNSHQNNNYGNNQGNRPMNNYSNNGYSGPRQSGWQESGPRGPRQNSPRYSQHPNNNNSYNNPRKSNYPRGGGSSNRGQSNKGRNTMTNDEFKYVDDPNRPRIKIGDPEKILNANPVEVDLSSKFSRNVSIFGEGKPREASPLRQKE